MDLSYVIQKEKNPLRVINMNHGIFVLLVIFQKQLKIAGKR